MHQGRARGQWGRCEGGGGVVTGHTVLHGGGSHWSHGATQRMCRGQQTAPRSY